MSYFDFLHLINKNHIKTIFELGSCDLTDAIRLSKHYEQASIYAFECNPNCISKCKNIFSKLNSIQQQKIIFIDKAISITDSDILFYKFDLSKYNNLGASSMFKIDFSNRDVNDPDYCRDNPQEEIVVKGTRLDTFIDENKIDDIDLLCIDLQGYELNALKSLGKHLNNVKYIITECSIVSTYVNGASFKELYEYLCQYNFRYVSSNKFGDNFPDLSLTGFSEFDAIFVHNSIFVNE